MHLNKSWDICEALMWTAPNTKKCTRRFNDWGSANSHCRKAELHSVRSAGASSWSGVREKYCWLAGGLKLVLERCERKILLGWRLLELPNRVLVCSKSTTVIVSQSQHLREETGEYNAFLAAWVFLPCIFVRGYVCQMNWVPTWNLCPHRLNGLPRAVPLFLYLRTLTTGWRFWPNSRILCTILRFCLYLGLLWLTQCKMRRSRYVLSEFVVYTYT